MVQSPEKKLTTDLVLQKLNLYKRDRHKPPIKILKNEFKWTTKEQAAHGHRVAQSLVLTI